VRGRWKEDFVDDADQQDVRDSSDSSDRPTGAEEPNEVVLQALARQLRPRFLRLAQAMRRDSQQLVVTTTQGAVLSLLRGGPLGVGELARAEGVRPPTMTQIINRMEQLGWVARTGPAVRGSRAEITDLGRAVAADVDARRIEQIAKQLRGLGPAERATLEAAIPVLDKVFGKPASL
jgi:DNA-binding MarR family transcriptional regulator